MSAVINGDARTKIVWTLSPAAFDEAAPLLAKRVVDLGVAALLTVFVPEREAKYLELRKEFDALAKSTGQDVALLFSLVGRRAFVFLGEASLNLSQGQELDVCVVCDKNACLNRKDPACGGDLRIAVTTEDMISPLHEGTRLALGYGESCIEIVRVVEREAAKIVARVRAVEPGALRSGMDVTSEVFPRGIFPLSAHDTNLLQGAVYDCADGVVVHGASHGSDLRSVRECLGGREQMRGGAAERLPPLLLCRVDSPKAMRAMNESFDILDGVFLNRSELGMSVHLHDLPFFQKNIIARCNKEGKMIVAASDLLSSMHKNSTPTRAEVSDIANLMLDGVDAIALGREVTEGPHSLEAARYCRETLLSSEGSLAWAWRDVKIDVDTDLDALAQCAFHAAQRVGAKAIVCLTRRGYTAARLSSLRPPIDVVAITYHARAKRQMNLMSAVRSVVIPGVTEIDNIFEATRQRLQSEFGFQKGDRVVFVSLSASQVSLRGSNLFLIEEFR